MTPNLQERLLAWVDVAIKRAEDFLNTVDEEWTSQEQIGLANNDLELYSALRVAIEMCSRNGYTTWDKSMVPLIDGKYEEEATKKWELAHGHDIRIKCYPEFECQLLIDPEDLLFAIGKAMGIEEPEPSYHGNGLGFL